LTASSRAVKYKLMRAQRFIAWSLCLCLAGMLASCQKSSVPSGEALSPSAIDPESFSIPDAGMRKLRGQVLYMPAYTSIPYNKDSYYDLGAFLAIHNADLSAPIDLRMVDAFDADGRRILSFLDRPKQLSPLATAIFPLALEGRRGAGANFIVEWTSSMPVTEPLVESVMKDLGSNLGISFLSQGRIIRELR
jgi:hypothetical protein